MKNYENEQILAQAVTAWGEAHRSEMVADIIKVVNYKSVCKDDESGYPFGLDCKKCADGMLQIGDEYGFETENDDYYNVSLLQKGEKKEEIGILGHLDVVPEGDGWTYQPYNAVEKDGFVIGRGSSDNKGAVIMSLYVMRCLRELGVSIQHTLRLICGLNEEAGMQDVEHYLATHTPPEYTIVCDGGWAMCIGEKGILTANLVQNVASGNLVELGGGVASNSVAGSAYAVVKNVSPDKLARLIHNATADCTISQESNLIRILMTGKAAHAAFPDTGESAIYKLNRLLTDYELLVGDAATAVKNLADAFVDDYGTGLGIAFEDEISGKTTCVGSMISYANGEIVQSINVRYAIEQKSDDLLQNLNSFCQARSISVGALNNSKPRYTDPKAPITKMLLDTCHEFLGEEYQPYAMGGGTHARKFPNALPYGPGGIACENPFGFPHGVNEAVHVDNLIRSMSVYAIAIVRLDNMLS